MKINRVIEDGAKFFAGACLLALLNACGGGVSASSDPTIPFAISPSTVTAYSGVPTTLTISGGGLRAPFLIVSSNATLLPVSIASVTGTQQIVITPGTVTAQQSGTITVSDATGVQASAAITVLPNLINSDITITGSAPVAIPDCAVAGVVCSGQTGTATLTVSQNGAPAKGRNVRFDVVQGAYQFPVDMAQTVFTNSVTVTSDESGRVTTVLRANTGATPQIATIKATDVTTGAFRTATFYIKQPSIGGSDFVTVPPEWTVTGTYKTVCPAGTVDYLIFGGTPPYTIRTSNSLLTSVSPTLTPSENPSRFTATFPAGTCGTGYNAIFTVTDATGISIQATLNVAPGTSDLPTPPPTITLSPTSVTLACAQSAQVLVTLAGYGTTAPTITTSIGTPVTPATALGVSVATNGVITLTRGNGTIGNPAPIPTTPIGVFVTVGAGSATPQQIFVNTQVTCP